MGSHVVLLLPYVRIWACVTSSDIIPYGILSYYTMERRCGQYSVTNFVAMLGCQCDVAAFDLRRSMCRPLNIDVG